MASNGAASFQRRRCRSSPAAAKDEGLQQLPHELLTDIGKNYLESPVWHACQLGEASPHLGKVFMDEELWINLFDSRFKEASRSLRRRMDCRTPSPNARQSYAQLHALEARFRGGQYSACGTFDNPHHGVPVLDLRIATNGFASAMAAFAALRDGLIMVYKLEPSNEKVGADNAEELRGEAFLQGLPVPAPGPELSHAPLRAAPQRELAPRLPGGPALCCLPIEGMDAKPMPPLLTAGYALGLLAAWELPSGRAFVPRQWEAAHSGRVSAIATCGSGRDVLLSAASDGLVKAWTLEADRFGELLQAFPGHDAAVVSVAASPMGRSIFLSGSHDRTMRLWDMRQVGEVARWQQRDWVTCVDFHPTMDEQVLSSDKFVHQWDVRRIGSTPLSSTHRHKKLVSRFRVDPLRLASCSLDGSVKVSSLEAPEMRVASPLASPTVGPSPAPVFPSLLDTLRANGGGDVCTLRTSADYVLCIDFDATRLLAGSVDGRVDAYDFSHKGHFQCGTPFSSPETSPQAVNNTVSRGLCEEPVDVQMVDFPALEI